MCSLSATNIVCATVSLCGQRHQCSPLSTHLREREISRGKGKSPDGEGDLLRSNEQQDVGKHQSHRVSRGIVKAHSKIVDNVGYPRIDGSQVDCVYNAAAAIDRVDKIPVRCVNA